MRFLNRVVKRGLTEKGPSELRLAGSERIGGEALGVGMAGAKAPRRD